MLTQTRQEKDVLSAEIFSKNLRTGRKIWETTMNDGTEKHVLIVNNGNRVNQSRNTVESS